jgi:hypothetical protein
VSRVLLSVTAVVAAMLGGCDVARGSLEPSTTAGTAVPATIATPGPGTTTTPATAGPPDVGVECANTQPPGAGDEPSRDGSDLVDMGDFGGGRWRLCLSGPISATAEHSAWCLWNPDRSAVTEIQGLPVPIGEIDYDATLSFDQADFTLGLTERASGTVTTYTADGGSAVVNATRDRTGGTQTFDVVLLIADPEAGAPAGLPPRFAGALRWTCGDAPPSR